MTPGPTCMQAGSKALLQAILAARRAGELGEALPSTFVTVRGLVAHAAMIGGSSVSEIQGANRSRPLVDLRRVVAWIAREATGVSYPNIGRFLGNRDHSTVINLRETGDHRVAIDPAFAALVERVWIAAECAPFGPRPATWVVPLALVALDDRDPRDLSPPAARRQRDEGDEEREHQLAMREVSWRLVSALHREHPDRVPRPPRPIASAARAARGGYCMAAC